MLPKLTITRILIKRRRHLDCDRVLYLVDKLIHFSAIGLSWVMNKDNFLLYTAVIFLFLKHDKSVGLVLIGLWLVMNIGLIVALLGTMSAYLLPLALLIIGGILYLISTR